MSNIGCYMGFPDLSQIFVSSPDGVANISGGRKYPSVKGRAGFYKTGKGVLVVCEINGLPRAENCEGGVHGFHIHEGESCSDEGAVAFAETKGHYNPEDCPHPGHAGDMPALFAVRGSAVLVFLTNRFALSEIIGKTVVIHSGADDFRSQPSGDAGEKIACGVIERCRG